jgi:hypothetical protein
MKTRKAILILAALALCISLPVAAAGKGKTDKDTLQGTWTVSVGVYQDKTLEKELEMSFSFKSDTMTNPMDDSELAYSVDEKTKTITAVGLSGTIKLVYKIVGANDLEFSLLSVKGSDGKETLVVGPGGTFTLLRLVRK